MRLKLGVLLLLFSINSYAHKDKIISKRYGNVKVCMKTGFDYSDIEKIKIVAQLSEKLSNRLHYKDTIFIEYVQDYTDVYENDLFQLEFNNSNYKFISGLENAKSIVSNNKGLSVRIFADRINIIDVLKLIEFSILNKEKTNSYLIDKVIKFNKYYDDELQKSIIIEGTDDNIIKKIISSKSKLIEELTSRKLLVKAQKKYGIEIYWKNDKFIFEYKFNHKSQKKILFEITDYFYHLYVNENNIIVFLDKKSFYFLDSNTINDSKLIHLDNGTYYPIRVQNFEDKLLLITDKGRGISIFLKNKNKLISKFE